MTSAFDPKQRSPSRALAVVSGAKVLGVLEGALAANTGARFKGDVPTYGVV